MKKQNVQKRFMSGVSLMLIFFVMFSVPVVTHAQKIGILESLPDLLETTNQSHNNAAKDIAEDLEIEHIRRTRNSKLEK